MTSDIIKILENSGWYPGREIDISDMIEDYKRFGFISPNSIIKKILQEFGNIKISFTTPDGLDNDIQINTDNISFVNQRSMKKFADILSDTLVPIGSIFDNTALLLGSYSGRLFMLSNKMFFIVGDNFYDALDTIINQKDILKIN